MQSGEIKIVPATNTVADSVLVDKLSLSIINWVPGQSVTVRAELSQSNGYARRQKTMLIDGAEYAAWGSDDAYLRQLVAQKLGVTIVQAAPAAAAV